MRFVLAVEELLDDERQDGVGTAGDPRDQPQVARAAREPAELGDPLLLGKVQQPQPDPAAVPVRGKRHLPGEGRCDRTAWCRAAGCRPGAATASASRATARDGLGRRRRAARRADGR